jgi:hypothetical protein
MADPVRILSIDGFCFCGLTIGKGLQQSSQPIRREEALSYVVENDVVGPPSAVPSPVQHVDVVRAPRHGRDQAQIRGSKIWYASAITGPPAVRGVLPR